MLLQGEIFQATSKGSDQTAHMRRLICGFAGRTHHIEIFARTSVIIVNVSRIESAG